MTTHQATPKTVSKTSAKRVTVTRQDACLHLAGDVTRYTVQSLVDAIDDVVQSNRRVEINCTQISQTDSAGVALCMEWMRRARTGQCQLHFTGVPAQMAALIKVSHLACFFDLRQT